MSIMLGNQSLQQIETRCEIRIPEPLRTKLIENRQENVSYKIQKGKWHCFDLPFMLVLGGEELFNEVKDTLIPMSDKFKEKLSVSYV